MSRLLEERALRWLLRLAGGSMLLAFGAVFLPVDWMAAAHRFLGLGEFPRTPITDYLARSISVLYGIHGSVLLCLATDPARYRPPIRLVASMNLLFGVLVLGIDLRAGMPWFWTLGEGPPIFAFGVVLLWLTRADSSLRD